MEYGNKLNLPYVIVRPGHVYGPGNEAISARVGIGTFGTFLHLGGPNTIPFTYVDNCADAIVLAGLKPGVDGEVFNVVDDDLPSSRQFLGLYKKNVSTLSSPCIFLIFPATCSVGSGRASPRGRKGSCLRPSIASGGTRSGREPATAMRN